MIEIKDHCSKGTRILLGEEKRKLINDMIKLLLYEEFQEISIPIIQEQSMFLGKVGDNHNLMYNFQDRGGRDLCLAPEYTTIVQSLAQGFFKHQKDVKLFYVQECFRGEKPQAGRYRQFTQLRVEILNPTKDYMFDDAACIYRLAEDLIHDCLPVDPDYTQTNLNAAKGLDYYKNGKGFEITCDSLGAQKQICGGGEYDGGVGFGIRIDRILLIKNN